MPKSQWLAEKLNIGQKDEMEIKGYRRNSLKYAATCLGIVLTGGILLIFLLWRKDFKLKLMYEQCALSEATKVLLKDSFEVYYEENVETDTSGPMNCSRYFINKKLKYAWDADIMHFEKIRPYDCDRSCDSFHLESSRGLKFQDVLERARVYGQNWIQIRVLPVYKLLFKEVKNPLYLSQLYTTVIWVAQGYYDYTGVLVLLAIIAVCLSVRQTRTQMISLRKMFDVTGAVTVLREGLEQEISSVDLVPGDVILVPAHGPHIMHCDAVVLQGTCSMDESVLTGESHPITKVPLPCDRNVAFSYDFHKRHVLFCGTQLIQGRGEEGQKFIRAVVIRTGFVSQKGELVRGILYPKPVHMAFYREVVKCVVFFFFLGLAGMVYTLYSWAINGGTAAEIILNGLDIITLSLPFAFPAAMTAINAFSQKRLKKNGIFCLNSNFVSVCGGIDVICFDKTGTLTENDLDIVGAIPIQEGEFRRPVEQAATLSEAHALLVAMATCHSLIQLDSEQFGGYSTDKKMFQSTGWTYAKGPDGLNPDFGCETPFIVRPPSPTSESKETSDAVAVLKQYPFESGLQKMTVVTKRKSDMHHDVYIKGAPEAVVALCDPITIPANFDSTLKYYTLQGYRVLALAAKTIPGHVTLAGIQALSREELESNAELIGLLVIQNSVKKETLPAIKAIHKARIRTAMVTGDNLQTAITIGKESGILGANERVIQVNASLASASVLAAQHLQVNFTDPLSQAEFIGSNMRKLQSVHTGEYGFAVDGNSFELLTKYDPSLLNKVIHRGKIFARMTPAHKQQLMERLQELGRQVAMVGDGCNDCGALKAANVGVSLSMTDASVAAPFTSVAQNISCVPVLLREGRATITSMYQTFMYVMSISHMMFIALLFQYSIATEPSDFQYLCWTYPIFLPPFFIYGIAEPSSFLHARRPIHHLWSLLPFLSFFSFLLWQTLVLTVGWFYCHSQPWFTPFEFVPGAFPSAPSYEQTTMYFLMCIGTLAGGLTFAPGPPYKKIIFQNKIFTGWAVFAFLFLTCMIFISEPNFAWWMNLKVVPYPEYVVVIYILGLTGGVICYCCERYLIKGWLHQWLWPKINKLRPLRHGYQRIEMELRAKPEWPQLGQDEDVTMRSSDRHRSADVQSDCTSVDASDARSSFRRSVRDFFGRPNVPMSPGRMSFRTFRGRQGGYTVNGPKSSSGSNTDPIPTAVTGFLKRQTSSDVKIPIEMELSEYKFPPPPEEIFQMDEDVQMTAHRPLDNDEWKPDERNIGTESSDDDDEVFLGSKKGKLEFHDAQETVDDPDIHLVSYVPNRRESDVSPSRQRRHLNGGVN